MALVVERNLLTRVGKDHRRSLSRAALEHPDLGVRLGHRVGMRRPVGVVVGVHLLPQHRSAERTRNVPLLARRESTRQERVRELLRLCVARVVFPREPKLKPLALEPGSGVKPGLGVDGWNAKLVVLV